MSDHHLASGIPMIEPQDAPEEISALYDETMTIFQSPYVPNISKAVANSPVVLQAMVDVFKTWGTMNIPQSLSSMISYAIASHSKCDYCSSFNELSCKMLGVDNAIMDSMAGDLSGVNPERIRAIIAFALKASKHPKDLTVEDYDALRDHGITDEEIVEIVYMAAMTVFMDMMADSLKLPVDIFIAEGLRQFNASNGSAM